MKKLILLTCLVTYPFLYQSQSFAQSEGDWTRIADAISPRVEAVNVTIDDKHFVFGGFNSSDLQITNTVEVYDPATDEWTELAPMPISVTHVGVAADGNDAWFVGGFEGNHPGTAVAVVQIYDTATDTWREGPSLPAPRAAGVLTRLGRHLHYFGGLHPDRDTDSEDHYVLDLDLPENGWASAAPLPLPRNHLGGIAKGGKIYAIGGQERHDTNRRFVKYLHVYDPVTDSWKRLADLPIARSHIEMATYSLNGNFAVAGGVGNGQGNNPAMDQIDAYDPETDTWSSMDPLPAKMIGMSASVINNRIIISHPGLGGPDQPSAMGWVRPFEDSSIDMLGFRPERMTFNVPKGSTASQRALLWTKEDSRSYEVDLGSAPSWVADIQPQSGTTDPNGAELTIVVDASDLVEGDYSGIIRVTANGVDAQELEINLTVTPAQFAFQEQEGRVVMEAEHYRQKTARNGHDWYIHHLSGGMGTTVQAGPNSGANYTTDYANLSPELQYQIVFETAGTYQVWARVWAPSVDDDSFHAGLDGNAPSTSEQITATGHGQWTWASLTMNGWAPSRLEVDAAGEHTFSIWMREDGLIIDRIVVSNDDSYVPDGSGPPESTQLETGQPFARFAGTVDDQNPLLVHFDASSSSDTDGMIQTWEWDFGDGNVGSGETVSHTFASADFFTVTLTVTDNEGRQGSTSWLVSTSGEVTYLEENEEVVIEAEHFRNKVVRSGHEWTMLPFTGSMGGTVQASPNIGTNHGTDYGSGAELQYQIRFSQSGTYRVWARIWAPSGDDDSFHVGLDGSSPASTGHLTTTTHQSWVWTNLTLDGLAPASLDLSTTGEHTFSVWIREDGVILDRFVLTTDPTFVPVGAGPAESQRVDSSPGGTASDEDAAVPDRIRLEQNYPNPFNPSTRIRYELPEASQVTLSVFNPLGQRIVTLVRENKSAGEHEVEFDARGLPSGVYFYVLDAGTFSRSRSMLLLK